MVELEQLYWGHDGSRYRLLGASSRAHVGDVDRIRDKLGTPDGLSELKPFLVSVPSGALLIMMCGQAGRPDNIGRRTIFFHTLIGDREECDRHHINAFSLWKAGVFKGECPDSTSVAAVPVPPLSELPASGAGSPPWSGEKLAIRSNAPENELLCRLLGSRINDVPWAGFTWRPLDDFGLYAISEHAELPDDRPCKDNQLKKTHTSQTISISSESSVPVNDGGGMMKIVSAVLGILLLISLGINIWFARCLARQSTPPKQTVISSSGAASNGRFDWDREIQGAPLIQEILKNNGGAYRYNEGDRMFLKKLEAYIKGSGR